MHISKSKSERLRRGREQRQADAVALGSEACEGWTAWFILSCCRNSLVGLMAMAALALLMLLELISPFVLSVPESQESLGLGEF